MNKIIFSNRLADLRKKRGFKTQYALAKAYNEKFPPKRRNDTMGNEGDFGGILGTIKNYENPNKESSPKLSVVCNLCELLDCDIDYLLGNIDVPRHTTQDMMDLTGLSEGACEKLKYLQLKNRSTGNLDCLSLLIDDVDFSYFLSLICGLTDEDDNSMITTDSGNARINVRRSDLVKFTIQNSIIEITSRVREKYLSKYETPERRFDEFIHKKMYIAAESLFAEGKLSEEAYREIIKQYDEGNFEFSPIQKGGFDNG